LIDPRVVVGCASSVLEVMNVINVRMKNIDADKLGDLKLSHVLLPPRSYSFSGQIIIVIHWDMNSAVQNFCYPLRGRTGFKTSPNQNHGDPMVVDVKKNDGFLFEGKENGVKQLIKFTEIENIDPKEQAATIHKHVVAVAKKRLHTPKIVKSFQNVESHSKPHYY